MNSDILTRTETAAALAEYTERAERLAALNLNCRNPQVRAARDAERAKLLEAASVARESLRDWD